MGTVCFLSWNSFVKNALLKSCTDSSFQQSIGLTALPTLCVADVLNEMQMSPWDYDKWSNLSSTDVFPVVGTGFHRLLVVVLLPIYQMAELHFC
jgi:hypothetical protein